MFAGGAAADARAGWSVAPGAVPPTVGPGRALFAGPGSNGGVPGVDAPGWSVVPPAAAPLAAGTMADAGAALRSSSVGGATSGGTVRCTGAHATMTPSSVSQAQAARGAFSRNTFFSIA